MSLELLLDELVKLCKCLMVLGFCNLMNYFYNEDKFVIGIGF